MYNYIKNILLCSKKTTLMVEKMIVYNRIEEIRGLKHTCVTIGNFDGIHRGHQVLIKKTVEYAKKHNMQSLVFTFQNHPINFFKPDTVKNILTIKEKVDVLKSFEVDVLVDVIFDKTATQISPEKYIKEILVEKLNVKKIIIGHDFGFARKREGTIETLKKYGEIYGYTVEVIEPVIIDDKRVSSTLIRNAVQENNIKKANKLLGRNYFVEGEIVKSRQIGRTIGFPTANLKIEKNKVLPGGGIYATKVTYNDNVFLGATNIGTNPTVNGNKLSVETHILDFDKEIYGEVIKVEFLDKIREEQKFENVNELMKQIQKDVKKIRKTFVF